MAFYDKYKPYVVRMPDGSLIYRVSGPSTVADMFLPGVDIRTQRAFDLREEQEIMGEIRRGQRAVLRSSYEAMMFDQSQCLIDARQAAAKLDDLAKYARAHNIPFGEKQMREWGKDALTRPIGMAASTQQLAADNVQLIDFVVANIEAGALTPAEAFDALMHLRRDEASLSVWLQADPKNQARLNAAIEKMRQKQDQSSDWPLRPDAHAPNRRP